MKRIGLLMFLCALAVAGALWATGASRAALNPVGATAQPPGPGRAAAPLENGPAVAPAPPFTTKPSLPVAIDPHWRANVRANTDVTTYAQQEPSIGVNPLNPLNVVASQKDERSAPGPGTETKEVWIDTSTDGGLTWPVNVHIPMPNTSLPQQSDPVVNFSDNNTVFVTIIGLSNAGGLGTNATMVAHSTDGGLTWTLPAVYLNQGQGGSDKEWTAVDTNPGSPYYRRIYTTWTNFAAGPAFIEKWSSDNGVTWNPTGGSNYVTVSFGSFDNGQFSMPVVLPNGNVLATWNDFGGQIAVARSTDGGQSFANPNAAAVNITDVNAVPGAGWRLNTIPSTIASPSTGTAVTVWADGRNGKDDIYYSRSTDNGVSWSAAARVAHNTAGSSYQVEPWISAAPNGRFDVVWYDDRDFPSALNTFHIYATHSTDDGATWTGPDEQVTDASSNLNVGIPTGSGWNGAAGDYIGVTSLNTVAYAVWTDTRSGTNEDVYTSAYTPPSQGTPTPTVTGTPPTATQTRTPGIPTITPTATATPCASSAIVNGGFETGALTPWTVLGTNPPPAVSTDQHNSGTYSALLGTVSGPEPLGDGSLYQTITVPASGGTLSYWWFGETTDTITFDWQDAYITDTSGNILATIMHNCQTIGWTNQTFSMAPYAGQTVRIEFLVHQDGFGDDTDMYVDDVQLLTACGTPGPTNTPGAATPTSTSTAVPTGAATNTPTVTATATMCPIQFTDVLPADPFYSYIRCLACRNIISGYTTSPPCASGQTPCYNGGANVTRGQVAKIVSNAAGYADPIPSTQQTFTDVPYTNPFWVYIERLAEPGRQYISGYSTSPPCTTGTPCFLPFNNVTRGQMAKIDANAGGYFDAIPSTQQTFTDVPNSNPFWVYIERAALHGVISGYSTSPPCPGGTPCFLWANNLTRNQAAKIVAVTFYPNCQTPAKR